MLNVFIVQVGRAAGLGTRGRYLWQRSDSVVEEPGWIALSSDTREEILKNKLVRVLRAMEHLLLPAQPARPQAFHRHNHGCSVLIGMQPIRNRAMHIKNHTQLYTPTLKNIWWRPGVPSHIHPMQHCTTLGTATCVCIPLPCTPAAFYADSGHLSSTLRTSEGNSLEREW